MLSSKSKSGRPSPEAQKRIEMQPDGHGEILIKYVMSVYIYIYIWVNYNDLTATSLGMMVSKGNHPQMALFQVSEIL